MFFNINRFHIFPLITWQFGIFFATQQIFPIFSNYVPKWRCSPDEEFSKNCSAYLHCRSEVEFDHIYFHSAAMEFDWICGWSAYWATFFSQLQFAGVLIGTFTCGSLSDNFGRKPVALGAITTGITASLLSAASPTWQFLLVTRFFVGLAVGGTLVVICTFGVARLLLTIICFFFNDWRSASVACALFASPAILIIAFVLPESPTWLHYQGKLEEMRESEKRQARIAGVEYTEVAHAPIVAKQGFKDIVRDVNLFKRVSVLWLMWFIASFCGYAIDLNSSNISGNLFLNQVCFAILIAGSKQVVLAFDTYSEHFSRRFLHQFSQLVAVICFSILTILVFADYDGTLILVVNVIGIVFIETSWDANYLCAIEATPTAMRASTIGSCSLIARVGAIMAPVLAFMNSHWAPSAYLTVVLLGSLNLFVSYVGLVETKGINLDHVEIDEVKAGNRDSQESVSMLSSNGTKKPAIA